VSAKVAVENLSVERGDTRVLDRVSFRVAEGEILGVLGPSGSGKTTLLRCVLGLLAPSTGTVELDGTRVSEPLRVIVPAERRRLGVVFQDLALWPHRSATGNLTFGLGARGVPRQERRARAAIMLERVGLAGLDDRRPSELSGGERQRLAIARALVNEPRAVLFDEPLANLDPVRKAELLEFLRGLLRERRTPAIYVTHDPRELVGLADQIAILEEGRISQLGTREDFRRSPATAFVEAVFRE
jgi:iron(III) transport system ATP-binding protein